LNSLPWKAEVLRTDVSLTGVQVVGLERSALTWHDVLRVIGVVILDEAEAVHELDLSDGSVSILVEESLNFLLASCCDSVSITSFMPALLLSYILVSFLFPLARALRKAMLKAMRRASDAQDGPNGRSAMRDNLLSLGRLPKYRRVPEYSAMVEDEQTEG
jgi:hypothetical protein